VTGPRSGRTDASPPARRIGATLALLSVAGILVGTLVPQTRGPFDDASFGHWCLVCGRLGGADLVANVLFFVPLGVGLGLAGWTWPRAAVAALALSAGVETAQLLAAAGRYPTLGDVVTNTAGGGIGAALAGTWRAWVLPRQTAATRLAVSAAAVWTAVLALSAWALGRSPESGPWPPVVGALPTAPQMGWFAGAVHRARVDGVAVPHDAASGGAAIVSMRTGASISGGVTASGSDPRPFAVPMLYVYGRHAPPPELVIGQQGRAAMVSVRLRASALRLRQPSLRLPDVFPARRVRGASPGEPSRAITGKFGDGALHLTVDDGRSVRARTLPLPATIGWALVAPFVRADSPSAPLLTAAWIAGFVLPLGYWAGWSRGDARRDRVSGWSLAVVGALAGMGLVPAAARGAPTPPGHWVVALVSVGVGLVIATAARRRVAGRPPFPDPRDRASLPP
jgi:hypothetical protein